MTSRSAQLAGIAVPGAAGPWEALGFTCDSDGRVRLANGALVVGADRSALIVCHMAGVSDVDGVPLLEAPTVAGIEHANGAFELDHVVVMTDSLQRTSAAVADALGLEQRRVSETPTVRQAFHRFDDRGGSRGCIVEVVENHRVEQPGVWGVVVNVHDLDAAVEAGQGAIGEPKTAVQPGRRIATVRASAGLGLAVALMTP